MKIRNIPIKIRNYIQVTRNRMKLKNQDFTIISNNCWGGFLYQKYGLEYRTPTIGLWFLGDDFVKFCTTLDYYLEQKLCFIPWEDARYYPVIKDSKPYPIAKLDDIEVYFMHYHSELEATEKWERRKRRINRDNMIFKLSQKDMCSRETVEAFMSLPHKHKVCFAYDAVPGTIFVPELKNMSGDEQTLVTPYFDDLEYLNRMK